MFVDILAGVCGEASAACCPPEETPALAAGMCLSNCTHIVKNGIEIHFFFFKARAAVRPGSPARVLPAMDADQVGVILKILSKFSLF